MAPSPGTIRLAVAACVLALAALRARQNLALHRPVTASSARFGDPSAIVNGVVEWGTFGLHTRTEQPAWVIVDLEGKFPIGEVRVFGRGDGPFSDGATRIGVQLSLDGHTFDRAIFCEPLVTQVSPCSVRLAGARARYVRLTSPTLVLSELEVFEAR